MKVYFLGTGGAMATVARDNSALLINWEEELILIDCPGSVITKIKKLGFAPQKVTSILITHIHTDHIYGLPGFVHALMLEEIQLNLYGSSETIHFCKKLLDLFLLRREKIRCRLNFIILSSGDDFKLGSLLWGRVMHVPHKASSLAYYFVCRQRKSEWLYSGDTPIFAPLFKQAAGIDTLIHECSAPSRFFKEFSYLPGMHTNSLELGRWAQKAGVKRLVPVHLFGELGYSLTEIEDEIRRNYTGELFIPHDLDKIDV